MNHFNVYDIAEITVNDNNHYTCSQRYCHCQFVSGERSIYFIY